MLASTIQWRVENDRLHVNVIGRLALNFLGIHRVKLDTYRWIYKQGVGALPLKIVDGDGAPCRAFATADVEFPELRP